MLDPHRLFAQPAFRRTPMPRRPLIALAAMFLLVAACGGSAGTAGAGQPSAGGATAGAAATTDQGAQSTEQPAATTGGGGAGTTDACKLLTVDEVSTATGQPNITAQVIPSANTDAASGCAFVSCGAIPVLNILILGSNTNTNPDDMLKLPLTEEVHVNGARAMFAPSAGNVFFIYKGSTVVTLQVLMPVNNDIKGTGTSLLQKIADRM